MSAISETTTLEATLEGLVDQSSLARVLEALANVCGAKATHIQGAWLDDATARQWQKASERLDWLANYMALRGV